MGKGYGERQGFRYSYAEGSVTAVNDVTGAVAQLEP